jgi:hypothetical protein
MESEMVEKEKDVLVIVLVAVEQFAGRFPDGSPESSSEEVNHLLEMVPEPPRDCFCQALSEESELSGTSLNSG